MKLSPYENVDDFCAVYGCPRNKLSRCLSRNVTFHRFPKDKDLRNKWKLSLQLAIAEPTQKSVVCSSHFETDCFKCEIKIKDSRTRYIRTLKKDAVPSIPVINVLFKKQKPSLELKRLDDCENETPAKFAKVQALASQFGKCQRSPLGLENGNVDHSSEMEARGRNHISGRDIASTSEVLSEGATNENTIQKNGDDGDDDNDIQVMRVFESLASKAERQQNIVFRSKSRLDPRRNSRPSMRPKNDRRASVLDKTEDLEQHRKYKALLHETSSCQNSGYRNEFAHGDKSDVYPALALVPPESSMVQQVEKLDGARDEYTSFAADYPSSGSAEMMLTNAKCTTEWILILSEKHKKSLHEQMIKADKMKELTQHLHKHNEKYVQEIAKKQWDLKSAFEIFKIEDEARALPNLTPEMEEFVRKALVPHPEHEKMTSAVKVVITRKDINTLRGLNWLNDEVINCYMDLIKERSSNSNGKYPKVWTFNTFFYPNLSTRGNIFLKRWNRKIDVFGYDMILAPIHEGIHWCLVQIDFRSKRILYLDSMGGRNMRCLELFLDYFVYESQERNVPFNADEWRLEHGEGNPKQRNGSDCGVFACTYAEFLSRDAKFLFDQSDMPFLRRKMVYELLNGLLPV